MLLFRGVIGGQVFAKDVFPALPTELPPDIWPGGLESNQRHGAFNAITLCYRPADQILFTTR